MCTNYLELHIILNLLLSSLYLAQSLPAKLTFYYRKSLKSVAYVALVHKAAEEIRITNFFKYIGVKKISKLVCSNL
jgi:hypothetical protein